MTDFRHRKMGTESRVNDGLCRLLTAGFSDELGKIQVKIVVWSLIAPGLHRFRTFYHFRTLLKAGLHSEAWVETPVSTSLSRSWLS